MKKVQGEKVSKEILFLEDSWNSDGSDSIDITINLKSNANFNFFFVGRTAVALIDLSLRLYAEITTGVFACVKEETNTLLSHISLIVQDIATGKYQISLYNNTATACLVRYRYQFTQV